MKIKQVMKPLNIDVLDRWILVALAWFCAAKIVWFLFIASEQGLYGDENEYYRKALGFFQEIGWRQRFNVLLGQEHRLPGPAMFFLISHFFDNYLVAVRIIASLFDTLLIGITSILLSRLVHRKATCLLIFLAAFSPMVLSFSFNLWGDLSAGWLAAISALGVCILLRGATYDSKWTLGFLIVGMTWGLSIYFRPSMSIFGLFLLGIVWVSTMGHQIRLAKRLQALLKASMALAIGCVIILSPWIVGQSFLHETVVYQPGQIVKEEKWLQWKIWAYSPDDKDWAYQNGPRYSSDLEAAIINYKGNRLEALKEMYRRVKEHTTALSAVRAWARNFQNVIANENQFLAGTMNKAGIENRSNIGMPSVKQATTRGGQQVATDWVPSPPWAKFLLLFNSYWYYSVLALAMVWMVRNSVRRNDQIPWFLLLTANLLVVFGMTIIHPGHGRYIFSALPMLMIAAVLCFSDIVELLAEIFLKNSTLVVKMQILIVVGVFFTGLTALVFAP